MKNKYVFVSAFLISLALLGVILTNLYVIRTEDKKKEERFTIVTSFYPVYVATLNIVGEESEEIELMNLSEPQTGCLHDYQMTPADMKLLSQADAFVINGGGIEGFLEEVTEAYPDIALVEACEGISLLEKGENAHAWMSVECYRTMVSNIASQLAKEDPEHAELYFNNAKAYDESLKDLQKQQEEIKTALKGTKIISFHEAFAYIAKDYGMKVVCNIDFDEERPISAGEPAQVLEAIQQDGASVIFAEELYGKDMAETILNEDDVEVMVLYLNPLNKGNYARDSYLYGMQANIDLIREMMVDGCAK